MTVALIVAAGSGERLGADRPKAFVQLAGRPMLQWSIDALSQAPSIERIVVAMPPGAQAPPGVQAVDGGAVRSESVRRALTAAADTELVLVHDAARPLLTAALAEAVIAALRDRPDVDAAIAAVPVTDTIKRADASHTVTDTLLRGELWAVQTPQVFRRRALERPEDGQHRRLARSRRTDHGDLLAATEVDRHAAQREHSAGVLLDDIGQAERDASVGHAGAGHPWESVTCMPSTRSEPETWTKPPANRPGLTGTSLWTPAWLTV